MIEQDAVAADALTKRYGAVCAVDGVSLRVPQGQIFGLLGPNSAGKTTLLECIEGVRSPDSGTISVLGLNHRDHPTEIKRRIGVQLQTTGFFDHLTVRETVAFYANLYQGSVDVDELLGRLDIQERAKTAVRDLSGGIRQRMSLAVALVNDPELVFLDEPTTGLDPQARHTVWDIVRSLRASGTTVVLTTHSMDEAEQLCDRVAIMTSGQLRADGAPADLVREHIGETVVEVAASGEDDLDDVRSLVTEGTCIERGDRMVVRSDNPPELASTLLALPKPPAEVRVRRGTLEDVYLLVAERGDQS